MWQLNCDISQTFINLPFALVSARDVSPTRPESFCSPATKTSRQFHFPKIKKKNKNQNLFKTQFLLNGGTLRRLLCWEQWVRTSEALTERESFQLCYFPVHPLVNMWWHPPQGPCWNAFVLFSLIMAIKDIMCTVRCLEPQVVKMPWGIKAGRKIKHKIFSISGASPGTLTAGAVQTGSNRTENWPQNDHKALVGVRWKP